METTTEDTASQQEELNVHIARALLLFLAAVIGMIVSAIVGGIHWQFDVILGIATFNLYRTFSFAHKVVLLKRDKPKGE